MLRLRKVYYEKHENYRKVSAKGEPKGIQEQTSKSRRKSSRVKKDPEQNVQLGIKQ